jgi:hypothetical protein
MVDTEASKMTRAQPADEAVRKALFTGEGEALPELADSSVPKREAVVGDTSTTESLSVLDEEELKSDASTSRPAVGSLGYFSHELLQATRQAYQDFKACCPDKFSMTLSQVMLLLVNHQHACGTSTVLN